MKDPRLVPDWLKNQSESAHSLVATYPHLAVLEDWVRRWWLQWESSCPLEGGASWPDEAICDLRGTCPHNDELHEAVQTCIAHPSWDASGGTPAGFVLGRILGRIAGEGAVDLNRFLRATLVGFRDVGGGIVFFEGFARSVPVAARAPWIANLSQPLTFLNSCLEPRSQSNDSAWISTLAEEEQRRIAGGEPANLWDQHEPRNIMPSPTAISCLHALFALSSPDALAALERVPSAGLRRTLIFFLGIGEDRDALLQALKDAPLLWENERWTGHCLAPIFVDAVTNHARSLVDTLERPPFPRDSDPAAIDQLYERELPAFLEQAFTVLIARNDGHWLSIDYAATLLRRTTSIDERRSRIDRLVLDTLLSAFSKVGLHAADVHRLARHRLACWQETPARWSRSLEYTAVASVLVNSPLEGEREWAAFVTTLTSTPTGGITGTIGSALFTTPLFASIGHALAATTIPHDTWARAWRELFVQRERARFGVIPTEGFQPSTYLAIGGLASLRFMIRERRTEATTLWLEIMNGLHHAAAALGWRTVGIQIRQLLAVVWAFVPLLEPDAWPNRIVAQRAKLHADPFLCLLAADSLVRNGLPQAEVLKVMGDAGCDPLAAGRELCEWLEAKGFGTKLEDVDVAQLLVGLSET